MCFITVNTFKPLKKKKARRMTAQEEAQLLNVVLEKTGIGNQLRWLAQYARPSSFHQRIIIDSMRNCKFYRKGR